MNSKTIRFIGTLMALSGAMVSALDAQTLAQPAPIVREVSAIQFGHAQDSQFVLCLPLTDDCTTPARKTLDLQPPVMAFAANATPDRAVADLKAPVKEIAAFNAAPTAAAKVIQPKKPHQRIRGTRKAPCPCVSANVPAQGSAAMRKPRANH
jgi:hypothetical protein